MNTKEVSKIGLIARADNSGLGTMSWEFYNHLKPVKTLLVQNHRYQIFPERYPDARVVQTKDILGADVDWLLEGIDVLLTIETPYRWDIYPLARRRGVKTVLIPMYECLPARIPYEPDLYIAPSLLDADELKDKNVVFIPTPVNRKVLPYQERKRAKHFVFHNGHGGGNGRNGAQALLEAIAKVQADVKFTIYSQIPLSCEDKRVDVMLGNFKNYWDIWQTGDVYVWPHMFDGLSLPVQEAISVGMPVLTTDFYPFNTWIPKEWLFSVKETREVKVFARVIDVHEPDPVAIAAKIDEFANKDISQDSKKADELAAALSWEVLLPKYLQALCNIS